MKAENFDPIEMQMFEQFAPNTFTMFVRVPGGFTFGDMQGVCFIPYECVVDDPIIYQTRLNKPIDEQTA
jgi:hypothetical protein